MNHRAIQEKLFALHDGELSGDEKQAVENHLPGCSDCRLILEEWQALAKNLFPAPQQPLGSEVFVAGVMRRIARPKAEPFAWARLLLESSWLAPAAGFAALWIMLMNGLIQSTVSVENLLLSNENTAIQQVLTGEKPSADDVLGLIMEEGS